MSTLLKVELSKLYSPVHLSCKCNNLAYVINIPQSSLLESVQ